MRNEKRVVGEDGGRLALTELRPFRSWTVLAMSILILILFWRSARAEWLEWKEGRLQRSGASPIRGARRKVGQICVRALVGEGERSRTRGEYARSAR